LKRLGAGTDGSEFDYSHLKLHPFFKDLDFDDLYSEKVPIDKSLFEKDEGSSTKSNSNENENPAAKSYLSKEI
jgi:hypothetical protein